MHMLWSDVFLVRFEFCGGRSPSWRRIDAPIFSCIVTCTKGDKYCVSSVLDGVKTMKL
jgi:hypothetical protein